MENTEECCPCCKNHCKRDNLHCSRGRKYFAAFEEENKEDTSSSLLYALMETGHSLRHMAKHGHKLDEEEILASLSKEEEDMLADMLSRLNLRKGKKHHRRHLKK